jgi:hypothetical protein
MTEIGIQEEFSKDWDWFASGPDGTIAHFTTAGMRSLPQSVKQDQEAAFRLIAYFFGEAPKSVRYRVRLEAEKESGGWADQLARDRYLKDFVTMASAGLFSYDTEPSRNRVDYFLVAIPEQPLRVEQLPPEIRDLVLRTQSPYVFAQTAHISSKDTIAW